MSLTKKVGVTSAIIFSAALLATSIQSRKSMDAEVTPAANNVASITTATKVHQVDPANVKSPQEVKLYLEEKLKGMQITDIEQSPLEGFYQVFYAGELLYVSNDGEFLFTGKLLELADGRPVNHSQLAIAKQDAKQAPLRAKAIAGIDESEMVVFKAKDEKFAVTVFTDVDCAYCRKLHKEVPQLNAQGVTIRYLAFPRAGIGSDAYNKLVSVWCADDRMSAMDEAKLQRKFGNNVCENPIAEQYNMTRVFNLSGTPALILPDGELIGGYIPANELYAHLSQKAAALDAKVKATAGK